MPWIFQSEQQRDAKLRLLKCLPCPHCMYAGALNRHGYLKGYDEQNFKQKAVRAMRVFCSNRGHAKGCGRTFSVWIADKVKRLFLNAHSLWRFLEQAATTENKSQAFRDLHSSMGDSAAYRIWKRFLHAQSNIRVKLAAICAPPKHLDQSRSQTSAQQTSAQATIAHLKEAFTDSLNPVADYQAATQSFFI